MENNNGCIKKAHPVLMYRLDENCVGYADKTDNCWNYSIYAMSKSPAMFNEYIAGYIQGKLQGQEMIKASRNNTWKNLYLCDPNHTYPHSIPPSENDKTMTEKMLRDNHLFLNKWLFSTGDHWEAKIAIQRLIFRMIGIYDGATNQPEPDIIDWRGLKNEDAVARLLDKTTNLWDEPLGYGDDPLSIIDVYFINAQMDLADIIANSREICYGNFKSDHCSAFLKRTGDDILWTHNSWCGFLAQSMTLSYCIYDYNEQKEEDERVDFVTQNCYCAGQFGSNMDFGFNKYGICFNETTHRYSHGEPKEEGVWLCWRAAAAEMFAKSIDEFYEYLSADNTGTYLNGYMLIDAKTDETALIEMSYKRFVMFRSDGKSLKVTDSTGIPVGDNDYDHGLITPEYIFGVNYPVSNKVAEDLKSTDNRPMRRVQFKERIDAVKDIETAKDLITYVGKDAQGKDEPLSIYGRWDLGYGTTSYLYSKTIPDGAVDAKAYSADRVRKLLDSLQFKPAGNGGKKAFWMLFGTAKVNGKPFVWSETDPDWQKQKENPAVDFVPDKLEGAWNEVSLFMD